MAIDFEIRLVPANDVRERIEKFFVGEREISNDLVINRLIKACLRHGETDFELETGSLLFLT